MDSAMNSSVSNESSLIKRLDFSSLSGINSMLAKEKCKDDKFPFELAQDVELAAMLMVCACVIV